MRSTPTASDAPARLARPVPAVRAAPSAVGAVAALMLGLVGVALLAVGVGITLVRGYRPALLLALPAGLVNLVVGSLGASSRVIVDPVRLELRSLWGRRVVRWDRVRAVHVSRALFGGHSLFLWRDGAWVPLPVYALFMAGGRRIVEAGLEAAVAARPGVRLGGWATVAFGPPPYGIFPGPEAASPPRRVR